MSTQLELNRDAYETMREDLESEHFGRVALLHDGELIAVYNDSGDAYEIGCEKFGLGGFTIEKIGEPPISLGIFTMALPNQEEE